MQTILDFQEGHFVLYGDHSIALQAQYDGFTRHSSGAWVTQNYDVAEKAEAYANDRAAEQIASLRFARRVRVAPSYALKPPVGYAVPAPSNAQYKAFQLAGIHFAETCFSKNQGVYNCDDMGAGKTIMTAGSINKDPEINHVLVFCPASVKINWMRELHRWLIRGLVIGFAEPGEPLPDAHIIICNYDIAGRCRVGLGDVEWDLIVCDEAQYVTNPEAQRTKSVLGIRGKRLLWLSGTPLINRPKELWTACTTLAPHVFGTDYVAFANRYCDRKLVKYPAGKGFNKKTGKPYTIWKNTWDDEGASNIEELNFLLRSTFMLRREKKDFLPQLPAKQRQLIVLPETGCARVIQEERKKWEVVCNVHGYDAAVRSIETEAGPAFSEMAAARKAVADAKLSVSTTFIRDALGSSGKIVVFCHHRDIITALMDSLVGFLPVSHHGGLTAVEKDSAVQAFVGDPEVRVFIGNIKSAGTGVDGLQKVCQHAIFVELPWDPATLNQAEDRLQRMGQEGSVLIQHLVLDGSLDAKMVGKILKKQELFNQVTK